MQFIDYLVRRLMRSHKKHYGLVGQMDLQHERQARALGPNTWFYPDSNAAIKLIQDLRSYGYYRDFEIADFHDYCENEPDEPPAAIHALAHMVRTEINNVDSLDSLNYIFATRLTKVDPLLHMWSKQVGGRMRIYYDFGAPLINNLVPMSPLLQVALKLKDIFELEREDVTVAIREDCLHNFEDFNLRSPFRVDYTRGHSFIEFNIPAEQIKARYHNPLLGSTYSAMVDEMLDYFCGSNSFADQITQFLEHGITDHQPFPDVKTVAARFNMSTATFYRRLQDAGVSYGQISAAVRMHQAKQLLDRGDLSINQVARRVGFSGAAGLSRFFKAQRGYTPTAYRARIEKNTEANFS